MFIKINSKNMSITLCKLFFNTNAFDIDIRFDFKFYLSIKN